MRYTLERATNGLFPLLPLPHTDTEGAHSRDPSHSHSGDSYGEGADAGTSAGVIEGNATATATVEDGDIEDDNARHSHMQNGDDDGKSAAMYYQQQQQQQQGGNVMTDE